jgi:hypothetical protein
MTIGSLDGGADGATEEFLKTLGLSETEIEDTLAEAAKAWETKLASFTSKGKEAVGSLSDNYSNLSKESAEAYGAMIDTVFKRGGSAAAEGMKSITSELLKATNGDLEK